MSGPEPKVHGMATAHGGECGTSRCDRRLIGGRRRCSGVWAQHSNIGTCSVFISSAVGVAAAASNAARGGGCLGAGTPLPEVAAAAAVWTKQPRV